MNGAKAISVYNFHRGSRSVLILISLKIALKQSSKKNGRIGNSFLGCFLIGKICTGGNEIHHLEHLNVFREYNEKAAVIDTSQTQDLSSLSFMFECESQPRLETTVDVSFPVW